MPRLGTAGVNPTTSSDQILAPILDNAAIKKGKLSIFSNSRNLALQKQKVGLISMDGNLLFCSELYIF